MKSLFALGAAVSLTVVAFAAETAAPVRPSSLGPSYLKPTELPDSVIQLPPAPAAGSAAEARDVEAQKAALTLRGTPRWELAKADAELFKPGATGALSCAAGIEINETATPKLHKLLRTSAADLGMSTGAAKRKYMRQRPFMVNGEPTCTPDWEKMLRQDGSYPSGHSAIGYGWGLILAELVPARAAELVARGRAFGDSRRVCNVHWLADVEEGRVPAAAIVAKLHSVPAFQKDVLAAKKEIAKAGPPKRDCAQEAAALAM